MIADARDQTRLWSAKDSWNTRGAVDKAAVDKSAVEEDKPVVGDKRVVVGGWWERVAKVESVIARSESVIAKVESAIVRFESVIAKVVLVFVKIQSVVG